MDNLINFPQGALAIPAAEIRMLADMLTSMQQACAYAAAALIERLDEADGDSDREETDLEDGFALSGHALRYAQRSGAGCYIADTGEDDDPAEEDDHSGGNVTDEPHDPESDCSI